MRYQHLDLDRFRRCEAVDTLAKGNIAATVCRPEDGHSATTKQPAVIYHRIGGADWDGEEEWPLVPAVTTNSHTDRNGQWAIENEIGSGNMMKRA